MSAKFKSRKFILAVAAGLIGLGNALLDASGGPSIDTNLVLTVIGPLVAYILGESYVDGNR